MNRTLGSNTSFSSVNMSKPENEGLNASLAGQNIELPNIVNDTTKDVGPVGNVTADRSTNSQRRLLEDTNSKGTQEGGSESKVNDKDDAGIHAATVENEEGLEEDADQSFDIFRQGEELADEYNYDYDDYVDESMWGDEGWTEDKHEKIEDYVNIDSHILCTPVSVEL